MTEALADIYILGATHGNEELGKAVVAQAHDRWPNVHTRIANPGAAEEGERALGPNQLQGEYPGSLKSDNPDAVAAAANMAWIGDAQGSPGALVYDVHNNYTPGVDYAAIGPRALKASVVGAFLLGYKNMVVGASPSYIAVPNSAAIEQSLDPNRPATADEQASRLCEGIGRLAAMSTTELCERYDAIAPQITWYFGYDIPTADADGTLASYMQEVEAIHQAKPFGTVAMSSQARDALGLPADIQLQSLTWHHDNMSNLAPELGDYITPTGIVVPRRQFFGGIAHKIDPPKEDGEWLRFDIDEYVTPTGQQQ
jgi:hypothetical protein